MDKHNIRLQICRDYLYARKLFLEFANNDDVLKGNDNIIGRIGEFIAYRFLELQNRNPVMNQNPTEKAYDMICENDVLISVKMITNENKKGQTSKTKDGWGELIIILLDENHKVDKIGHLTKAQFEIALNTSSKWNNPTPYCRKSLLNIDGLIGVYGTIFYKKYLDKLNLI